MYVKLLLKSYYDNVVMSKNYFPLIVISKNKIK